MKTFITAVILTASVAFGGNVAMAAQTHHVKPHHVAVAHRAPVQQQAAFPDILGALFGLPGAYTGPTASRGKADDGEYVSMESPTYDPGPTVDNSAWVQQQAADALAAAAQQRELDIEQMNATLAAVAEQNALDTQNTLQTELNAGM